MGFYALAFALLLHCFCIVALRVKWALLGGNKGERSSTVIREEGSERLSD